MHTARMQTEPHAKPQQRRRAREIFLVLVVGIAVAVALAGVVEDAGTLPEGAFASVNGQALPLEQLDVLLARLGEQLGHTPARAERAEVIARLVDEELLLQQGLALGLARQDSRLRSQLVQEVIRQVVAQSATASVDEVALTEFLAQNAGYFRRPAQYRVERRIFEDRALAQRALQGDAAALVQGVVDVELPGSLLGEARLRDYLGSALAARIAALASGEGVLEPRARGAAVLRLVTREPAATPVLAEIRTQVESEYRRRRDEAALADYVARLRRDARLVLEGEEPPG
jgi:hypothetical protein